MNTCVFCKNLSGEMPASFVLRDRLVSAFLDIQPVHLGHVLVVPNQHAASLGEVPPPTLHAMMEAAAQLAQVLRGEPLLCEGVNLFLADGEVAGQEVDHIHLHVIPRFAGDGFGLRFAAEYGTLPQRDDLDRVATVLREKLARVRDIWTRAD